MDKVHLVYKITNLLNQKFYIGIHSTTNPNDNYMGGGTRLRWAQKKYGINNFKKEILYSFDTREQAFKKEEELVNIECLSNKSCYNLIIGGPNGRITTPELRKLHTRFRIKPQKDSNFDDKWYYKFELIKSFRYDFSNPSVFPFAKDRKEQDSWAETMNPDRFLEAISNLYNSVKTHKTAKKIIELAFKYPGFHANIQMTKTSREIQAVK